MKKLIFILTAIFVVGCGDSTPAKKTTSGTGNSLPAGGFTDTTAGGETKKQAAGEAGGGLKSQ